MEAVRSEAAGGQLRREIEAGHVEPRRELAAAYDERYARFVEALRERGYVGRDT